MKKAFTLIELLVVIAIIAILAAILFPVFAQAKLAAKKTADLSNVKQTITSTMIYSNDSDDLLPHGLKFQPYVIAARLMPYTKNREIFKVPGSSSPQGTLQKKQHDNGSGDYMTKPDDGCVGLGTSTVGTAKWYNDIYPALDYDVNRYIFGYQSGCGGADNYFEPAPNTTTGSPAGEGVEDLGPAYGNVTFTSPSKVVLMIDFPTNGNLLPGGPGVPFWGSKFKGYWNGSNVNHLDGHAKFYPMTKLLPGLDENLNYTACNVNEGLTAPANAWSNNAACDGKSYNYWGTNFASQNNQ